LSRPKKYKNDAERHAAFRKRKKDAAAAAIPKDVPAILRILLWLRDEITLRLDGLGLVSRRGNKRRLIIAPDPSTPGYGSLAEKLINLVGFIEQGLDKTGVPDRGPRPGDAQRGSLLDHLESLRDEITRRRWAGAGPQRGLTRYRISSSDASDYGVLLDKLIELLNLILKELDQAESWPI
jgi:hypothetical protein